MAAYITVFCNFYLAVICCALVSASEINLGIRDIKKGVFLIAVPDLPDPHFSRTVILLLMYEKQGALGLVINRSTDIPVEHAFPGLKGIERLSLPVYYGGPVGQDHVMALLRSIEPLEGAKKVFDHVYVAEDKKPLIEIIHGPDPDKRVRIYSGYSGWGPGQLDGEIARKDWIITAADPEIVFSEDPSGIWEDLLKRGDKIQVNAGGILIDSYPKFGELILALTKYMRYF